MKRWLFLLLPILCLTSCATETKHGQNGYTADEMDKIVKSYFHDYTLSNTNYFSHRTTEYIYGLNKKGFYASLSFSCDDFFEKEIKDTRTGDVEFYYLNYDRLNKQEHDSYLSVNVSDQDSNYSTSITQTIHIQDYKKYTVFILNPSRLDLGGDKIMTQSGEDFRYTYTSSSVSMGTTIKRSEYRNLFFSERKYELGLNEYHYKSNQKIGEYFYKQTYYFDGNPRFEGLEQGIVNFKTGSVDESLLNNKKHEIAAYNSAKSLNSLFKKMGDTEFVTSIS